MRQPCARRGPHLQSVQRCALLAASVTRRRANKILSTATPVLATLLAALLVLLGLLAASDALHRTFHHKGNGGSDPCMACLLVKGQVESADFGPVLAAAIPDLLCAAPMPGPVASPEFTFLAFHSRAPPAIAFPLPVVA